jgi:hypothetical protein
MKLPKNLKQPINVLTKKESDFVPFEPPEI